MKKFSSLAEVEAATEFELNRDFQLMTLITNHPDFSSDNNNVQLLIRTYVDDYNLSVVHHVTHIVASDIADSDEATLYALRKKHLAFARQNERSTIRDYINLETFVTDDIDDLAETFLYFESAEKAHLYLCELMSPTYNASYTRF